MKYQKRPIIVEATQWFKNGDHPEDNCSEIKPTNTAPFAGEGQVVGYYRHPGVDGQTKCRHCGKIMHVHGWIDTPEQGHIVCPGDWIITEVAGGRYSCKDEIFKKNYRIT